MFGIGMSELLIIFVFALIFIGPKKLPELAKNLGKGLREFQKAKDDLMNHVNDAAKQESTPEKIAQVENPSDSPSQKNDADDTKGHS